MLTIGLASVPFFNTFYEKWTEIPVNLPKVKSEAPIILILPTERKPFNMDGGIGSCCCWLEVDNKKVKHKYSVAKNKIKK